LVREKGTRWVGKKKHEESKSPLEGAELRKGTGWNGPRSLPKMVSGNEGGDPLRGALKNFRVERKVKKTFLGGEGFQSNCVPGKRKSRNHAFVPKKRMKRVHRRPRATYGFCRITIPSQKRWAVPYSIENQAKKRLGKKPVGDTPQRPQASGGRVSNGGRKKQRPMEGTKI